jgi:hypothetical protein
MNYDGVQSLRKQISQTLFRFIEKCRYQSRPDSSLVFVVEERRSLCVSFGEGVSGKVYPLRPAFSADILQLNGGRLPNLKLNLSIIIIVRGDIRFHLSYFSIGLRSHLPAFRRRFARVELLRL